MSSYVEFKLYERNFRYYSAERIDIEFVGKKKTYWRQIKFYNNGIYKQIGFSVDGKEIKMKLHRVIYYAHNPKWDIYDASSNNLIDHRVHIDGVPLDNSITNLRVVNIQQNAFNTNAKGYCFDKQTNKYLTEIQINGKKKHLGRFDTAEQARNAYLEAKKIYHLIV